MLKQASTYMIIVMVLVRCDCSHDMHSFVEEQNEQSQTLDNAALMLKVANAEGTIAAMAVFWMAFFPELHTAPTEALTPETHGHNPQEWIVGGELNCDALKAKLDNLSTPLGTVSSIMSLTCSDAFAASDAKAEGGKYQFELTGGLANSTQVSAPTTQEPNTWLALGTQFRFKFGLISSNGTYGTSHAGRLLIKIEIWWDWVSQFCTWDLGLMKAYIGDAEVSDKKAWDYHVIELITGAYLTAPDGGDDRDVFGKYIMSPESLARDPDTQKYNATEIPQSSVQSNDTGQEKPYNTKSCVGAEMFTPMPTAAITATDPLGNENDDTTYQCLGDFLMPVQIPWPPRHLYYPSVRIESTDYEAGVDNWAALPDYPTASQ